MKSDVTRWKTGISTWDLSPENLMRLKRAGIDCVEFCPQEYDDIPWQQVRQNADQAGVEIWSLHLDYDWAIHIADPDENVRRGAVETQSWFIRQAAAIGIGRCVIHASLEPIPDAERSVWLAQAQRSLGELARCAADAGVTLCVEDLPRTCLGRTADEMLQLLSADDRLRVCFDVNHLLTSNGCTHLEFVQKLGQRIATVHLSDYDFADEKHFVPGSGRINWRELITALEDAGYPGPFMCECYFEPHPDFPHVPWLPVEKLKERQMCIKTFEGPLNG